MDYKKLRTIDVSAFIEKKGNLNYISWSRSIDLLLQQDPTAKWHFHDVIYYGETAMVGCTLVAFDKSIEMKLPVLSGNNQAVKNPNAFDINRAQMRCLTKAVACFGIGLIQLYADDDLPPDDDLIDQYLAKIKSCKTQDELRNIYKEAFSATSKDAESQKLIIKAKDERKKEIEAN